MHVSCLIGIKFENFVALFDVQTPKVWDGTIHRLATRTNYTTIQRYIPQSPTSHAPVRKELLCLCISKTQPTRLL